jgi:hypothetical protein
VTANVPVRREWLPDPEDGLDDEWVLATDFDAVVAERDALRERILNLEAHIRAIRAAECEDEDDAPPSLPDTKERG